LMLLAGILPDRNSPALRVKQFLLQGGNLGRKKSQNIVTLSHNF